MPSRPITTVIVIVIISIIIIIIITMSLGLYRQNHLLDITVVDLHQTSVELYHIMYHIIIIIICCAQITQFNQTIRTNELSFMAE